jgi:hypothetical protein
MVPAIFIEFVTFVFAFTIITSHTVRSRTVRLLRRLSYAIVFTLFVGRLVQSILFSILLDIDLNARVLFFVIYLGFPLLLIVLLMAVTFASIISIKHISDIMSFAVLCIICSLSAATYAWMYSRDDPDYMLNRDAFMITYSVWLLCIGSVEHFLV